MQSHFDAYVTKTLIDKKGDAYFALGDGSVRLMGPQGSLSKDVHEGAVLCACHHPSGIGLLTGGDDGRVAWTQRTDRALITSQIAQLDGQWIDALTASAASNLCAFASGRAVHVIDILGPRTLHPFNHERSVAGLAFDFKGRRLAAATYGGVALWYAKIATQTPVMLKWAGSHLHAKFSPDGQFLVSALQDNQLHGWRLADGKSMRMGGYPAKVQSLAFFDRGRLLATSGAPGAVVWPFANANGPMGSTAQEIGFADGALVHQVAACPQRPILAAGLADGRVWWADLSTGEQWPLAPATGTPITTLALSADGKRLAFGDENGGVALLDLDRQAHPKV